MTPPDLVPMLLDVSIDPCDGSGHPSLQYVLIRGFAAMGWEQPRAASEDMAAEILKMIRPPKQPGTSEARLREALEKIACHHVTVAPLWWQIEARKALFLLASGTDRGCVCQNQHRRGYCTEPGCTYSLSDTKAALRGNQSDGGECACGKFNDGEKCPDDDGRPLCVNPSEPSSTRSEVTALADIAAERERQRGVEGWSSVHDDGHDTGEMAGAAACYALSTIKHWAKDQVIKLIWPWADEWWKPKDARRNLVKAGALIVAEIERLDRLDQFEIRRKK